jgi:PAS domain S-box-containing protein
MLAHKKLEEPEKELRAQSLPEAAPEMEETRFRLTAIVESSNDAIISKNLDAVITSWNAAAQRIFGYTEEETVGQPITILIPPELRDEENQILARLRAGERIEHYETIRVTKTGKKVNVSLTISPIKDSTGNVVGFSKIARDITQRKQAEEALRASEERFRRAALAGKMFAYEWDAATDVIVRSAEFAQVLGDEPVETTGQQGLARIHPDDRETVKAALAALTPENPHLRISYRMARRDGAFIWVERTSRAHFDEQGRILRIIGMVADAEERKKAEEALKESEQRYRLLFERNVAGVGIASLDGRVLDCNDGWARILGYESKNEVVGRQASTFYFHPAERQRLLDELLENQAVFSRELQMRRKDGTPVWVMFNAAALKSEHNTSVLQSTMIDISEWKRAEEALLGMTRKLVDAQEQERVRIGRELHDDINQRLAMLSVELDQLEQSPTEVQSRVHEIRKELCQITDDVQALSHDLHSSKLDYLGAIAGMKSWCKEVAVRHKIEVAFRSDFSGNLPLDVGLPLFRVLQEAVTNSIKHSGEKWVEVQLRGDPGEIHLVVRDSGKGFDVETVLQGKGLGLTSMRERVRLVNGTIAIESNPTGGTKIHVHIPLGQWNNAEQLSAVS